MAKPKRSLENAGISDNAYLAIMQRVANDNYKNWELPNSDAALVHALNDNTYNYRGYYNKYPNGKGNAIDHWTDEFKTVYHPTFSKESKYSGKKSQYNPKGITGGTWYGEYFLPSVDQYVERSRFKNGGEDGNWYEQFKANHPVITEAASYLPVVGSAMDVYEAVNNPTGGNIFNAAVSVGSDILGYRILRNMGKALKTMKGRRIYQEAIDRHNLRTGRLKPNKGGTTPASNLAAKEEALMFGYPFAQITNASVNAGINYGQQERNRIKRPNGGNNKVYIVQKGDTLGDISKRFSGNAKDYLQVANANNISNPDLIEIGQKIVIPEKFDRPLKFNEIPTNNRISVIDNYSPYYNYIIEGDKIYYSRKGHNDYWVDISDNDVARKNLHNFIETKYDYRGYQDNERQIGQQIKDNTYNYKEAIKPKSNKRFTLSGDVKLSPMVERPSSLAIQKRNFNNPAPKEESKTFIDDILEGVTDLWQKGTNYISRQYEKIVGDSDSASTLVMPKQAEINSKYDIMPKSYTGDTVNIDKNKYIIPESINLNDVRLGVRNRGSREPLNTEGAIITNFHAYTPYDQVDKKNKTATYMGIDASGNFKVGTIDSFAKGDMLTRTYANDVESFAKDAKGNQIWKNDAAHGNKSRNVPVLNVVQNGKTVKGSLNILTDKGSNNSNTYGNITGGRVILEAGNERRLVSGSIDDIEKQFNDIKERHGVKTVRMYTLDNGSYNRGLRTKNRVLSAADLKAYDNQNSGGGNFMYLLDGNAYKSDTVRTNNIRTTNSESYKKGHGLVNERKGVVLHHTAFEEDDLTNVTRHLTNPESEASSHVIIGYNGNRRVLASPDKVTFHAGKSVWNNRQDVNDFMLGIEFQGNTNKKDLTENQIRSAVEYLKPIIKENNIPLENIVTHEQVRAMYNEFAKKQGKAIAPNKPDINRRNYEMIINRLLKEVYYPKNKRSLETRGKRDN